MNPSRLSVDSGRTSACVDACRSSSVSDPITVTRGSVVDNSSHVAQPDAVSLKSVYSCTTTAYGQPDIECIVTGVSAIDDTELLIGDLKE